MRIVVDLPAPLLPRKPKISPRAHVERQVVDGDERRRSGGSGAGRRSHRHGHGSDRGRSGLSAQPPARSRAVAPSRATFGERARAIELGLQQRASSARRARRCWSRHPALKRSPTTRHASERGADAVGGRGDGGAARVDLEPRAAGPRRRPGDRSRATRASAARAVAAASACSARLRPPSQSDQVTLTDDVPRVLPVADARKDARVRARVVVAAGDDDLRPGLGRSQRRCARARAPARSSSARRSGRRPCACAIERIRRGRSMRRRRLEGGCAARCESRRRCRSAAADRLRRSPRWLAASMASRRCARLLRLGRQHVVRRDEPLLETRAQIADVRVDALERSRDDPLGFRRGHQRPERARDLQAQIGARGGEVLSGGFAARRARRARARRRGRRCRSATAGRAELR